MAEPAYRIFRGAIGTGNEEWLEAVGGLENARHRMEEIAAAKPGLYFDSCSGRKRGRSKPPSERGAEVGRA